MSEVHAGTQVTQPAVIVANRHGEATLICDYSVYGMVEEIRFSLLKKTKKHISEICVFSFNTKYEHASIGDTIRCLGIPSPHNVTFNISGLTAEDTGLYTCKMEVMYPPPYRSSEGNATLVYVSDLTYQCAQSIEPVEDNMYKWTLLIVFVVLLLYSLIATGILLCKGMKYKNNGSARLCGYQHLVFFLFFLLSSSTINAYVKKGREGGILDITSKYYNLTTRIITLIMFNFETGVNPQLYCAECHQILQYLVILCSFAERLLYFRSF
ncbi:unnamed protein product [Ranitomeya imitator]|uniref:Cytotoxic T-lymphocyte protein 4 n=1 Tax=Ranitomeya imitator TaxID=111125 RepID=A0ABN9LF36_9NEOB|nr:unnamed protein product [Ranitomeya imitator]